MRHRPQPPACKLLGRASGTSTGAFSVGTGTVSGFVDQFTGFQGGLINWIASNTGTTQERLTFAKAFNNPPVCSITPASGTSALNIVRYSILTTTTVTFGDTSAFPTSTAWTFMCHVNPN